MLIGLSGMIRSCMVVVACSLWIPLVLGIRVTLYCPACGKSFIVHCMDPAGLLLSGGVNPSLTREDGAGEGVSSGKNRLTLMVDCWPTSGMCW